MTKFEEELYNNVKVTNIELTTEAEYKKTTLINHFKNWHSDDEYQELLDKYSNLNDHYEKEVIRSSKLESQIIDLKSQLQQQALPVVPEWLDIEIKHFKSTSKHPTVDVVFGVADAIVAVKNVNTHSKLYDYLFCGKQDVCNQHQAIFALAFITGKYQVEKPKLFYLKNKLTTSYLALDTNTGYYEHWGEEIIPKLLNKQGYKLSFTQQEIESMQTGSYEQIEVEK